jgi:hypothetical protein
MLLKIKEAKKFFNKPFSLLVIRIISISVADPGCLSRIPDPDFYPSRIPDLGPKNSNERQG